MAFWERISKEVKDLGEEINTYHEDIELKKGYAYGDHMDSTFYFRGIEILKINTEKNKLKFFDGFSQLNGKEKQYLHDMATKGYLKKITFTDKKD